MRPDTNLPAWLVPRWIPALIGVESFVGAGGVTGPGAAPAPGSLMLIPPTSAVPITMDGSMGGFMGGMMGGMLGVMINISSFAVLVTTVVVTVICLAMYDALIVLVRSSAGKRYAKDPVCDMLVDIATPG